MKHLYHDEMHIEDESRPVEQFMSFSPSCELIPLKLRPPEVVGRVISEFCTHVGTYGMGGPGFVGFRFDNKEQLVIAVWGADDWLLVNGQPLRRQDSALITGATIGALDVGPTTMTMKLSNGTIVSMDGRNHRREASLQHNEDLRNAIGLAPVTTIWV